MKKILLYVFLLVSSAAICQTKYINYQGLARDGGGIPLQSKTITIRASILSDSTGKVVDYSEAHLVKTSAQGQFALAIGKGTVLSGLYEKSINWAGGSKFLKIEMSPDGINYVLSGISQIQNVPYAIYAQNAGNVVNYNGQLPVAVSKTNEIGLNAATSPGDLMSWDGTNWVAKPPVVQHFTVNNLQPSLVTNYFISLYGIYPTPAGGSPYIGEIILFPGYFEPAGFALCDGRLLSISENETLFNVIGTTFGGDGQTTFAIPDLRGRVAIHAGTLKGGAQYILGSQGGTETISK
jgi:microcystin-dependent protein